MTTVQPPADEDLTDAIAISREHMEAAVEFLIAAERQGQLSELALNVIAELDKAICILREAIR